MRSAGQGGFSLVELMIATSVFALIAGVSFALLNSGLRAHEATGALTEALSSSARMSLLIRGEVASCQSVSLRNDGALEIIDADGGEIVYASTDLGREIVVYRYRRVGGALVERPSQPLLRMSANDVQEPHVEFFAPSPDQARCRIVTRGFDASFGARRWIQP